MPTSIPVAPAVPVRNAAVRYEESTKGSFWFIAKGVILTLLTVGIYRFWFTTAIRKNLWARAFIDGSPAEYTGKAHELLLGFLVALAVLLPAYIAVFVATMYLPDPTLGLLAAYILLFLLVQFARYRARRYIASRTLWRGIRFRQDGSALAYTALAGGWWLVTLLTLGIGYPFMRASLERYRMRHTLLGEARFTSDASGLSVFFHWMIVYALSILPILGCVIVSLAADDFEVPMDALIGDTLAMKLVGIYIYYRDLLPAPAVNAIVLIILGSIALSPVLRPYYRAREARAFYSAIKLAGARLNSKLSATDTYINYLGFYSIFLILVAVIIVPYIVMYVLSKNIGPGLAGGQFELWYFAVGYFLGIISVSWLYFRFFHVGRLAIIAETLSIIGADALEAVTASTRQVDDKLAEGVADAVDPGGIEIGF